LLGCPVEQVEAEQVGREGAPGARGAETKQRPVTLTPLMIRWLSQHELTWCGLLVGILTWLLTSAWLSFASAG
jgi:hypothetical protein